MLSLWSHSSQAAKSRLEPASISLCIVPLTMGLFCLWVTESSLLTQCLQVPLLRGPPGPSSLELLDVSFRLLAHSLDAQKMFLGVGGPAAGVDHSPPGCS